MLPFNPYGQLNQFQPQLPQVQQPQVQQPTNPIQYVNSVESADAYSLQPNQSVVLFNANCDEFYIITADASGSKSRKDFTFKAKEKGAGGSYVTRKEFNELKRQVLGKNKKENKDE